jgi:dTDP-4-amino-4,6-dideoxygalactose transaminase
LRKLCDELGLWYIADAAQSLGARREDLPASCFADALVVSFTVGKPLFAGEGGAVLTNNVDLYEKVVWFTQHPYRQKRELGLSLYNEFGLNARIHPLAAVWANAVFESSLREVESHRRDCFEIIDALNESGLSAQIHFGENGIEPSFFRLTAAWKGKPCELRLLKRIGKKGLDVRLEAAPVQLLYNQPSFIAQFARRLAASPRCPRAEDQARRRLAIKRTCPV